MSDLKGNRGEWSELYATLTLLAVGEIYAADENMEKIENMVFPVLKILREEKDNSRHYSINGNIKIIDPINNILLAEIEKSSFISAAKIVFDNISRLSGRSIHIQSFEQKESLIEFLQTIDITALKAKSTNKSDITIQIHDQITGSTPILGFSIKSMIGNKSTLFNPAPGTNFIFRVWHQDDNAEIDLDAFNRLTYTSGSKIKHRILELETLNYNFDFVKVESQVLELNLKLIDGDLPKILAYMLKYRFSRNKTKIIDLLQILSEENPLNYNLEHGHPFYKYKIIKFLYDVALGMTPEVVWNGDINANGGIIVVKNDGEVLAYHTYYKHKFEEYLFNNTMLEQPSTSEDENNPGYPETKENYPGKTIKEYKYGWPYRENNDLFFKLNLQVRFLK
jgi:hypothetical protein